MAALLVGAKSTQSPTSSPTLEIEFIGNGFCLDCANNMYSLIKGSFYNGEDCASWCLQHPTSLIGYVEEPNPQNVPNLTYCFCLFEGGQHPIKPLPNYTYTPALDQGRKFKGTGPITIVRYLPKRPTSKLQVLHIQKCKSSWNVWNILCLYLTAHSFNCYAVLF